MEVCTTLEWLWKGSDMDRSGAISRNEPKMMDSLTLMGSSSESAFGYTVVRTQIIEKAMLDESKGCEAN